MPMGLRSTGDDLDLRPREVRRIIIFVRVTRAERDAIAVAAANAGMPIVDFIRAATRELIARERAKDIVPEPAALRKKKRR